MSFLSKVLTTTVLASVATGTLIYFNRKLARENLSIIDSTYASYRKASEDDNNRNSEDTSCASGAYKQEIINDNEWRNQEVAKQEKWLSAPLYKQVIPPCFPDLMGP